MRLGLGLIIGLKGAPHHDRHNQGHRETLEVTTDSSVEVFETTPKLPELQTTSSSVEEKEILQTTTESSDIIDKYDLQNAVTEAPAQDDAEKAPTEAASLDLEKELADLVKTTQQSLTLVPNQMENETTPSTDVENDDSKSEDEKTENQEVSQVEAETEDSPAEPEETENSEDLDNSEVTKLDDSGPESNQEQTEVPQEITEQPNEESEDSLEVEQQQNNSTEAVSDGGSEEKTKEEISQLDNTEGTQEGEENETSESETSEANDGEDAPEDPVTAAEEVPTEVEESEEAAESVPEDSHVELPDSSEDQVERSESESESNLPADSEPLEVSETSETADLNESEPTVDSETPTGGEVPTENESSEAVQEGDGNSDDSSPDTNLSENSEVDEIVSENNDEVGEPQISEPPITPVVDDHESLVEGAQPTERSMLSDFAADLNGLSHSSEEPADPSIVVVPDDYHPESPLNVAEASELPNDAPQAGEDSVQSSNEAPIETDQTSIDDSVSENDSDIAQAFPEVSNDVAEPTPDDVKTPEQLADINLADQIDGFANLSPEQKQLIEQYVKMQLVGADKDESDDRLEDDEQEAEEAPEVVPEVVPEVGTVPPADDLYGENENDFDDGHIPPDLYGEPEPDEEVAETAYDYKNDYDQAQDSNAEKAGGLSWEEPEYSDQADTHDQYDSFKAQEDDSHYIDHDNDENFNFDSEGSSDTVDYSDIIKTIVADTGDITEEPNANKNSGIDLDELIDRRKVELHQERYREMERNDIEESKQSSKGWMIFFGIVGLFFIMMTRRKVRRLMPSSLGSRGGGSGGSSQREKLTTVTTDRAYGSSNVDPWDWGKSD